MTDKKFTVWLVDGDEVNDHYLTEEQAEKLAEEYREAGYEVQIEEIQDED